MRDYLVLCDRAVAELGADQANVLRGFTAVLILNHIPDWLQYKLLTGQRRALELDGNDGGPVRDTFESRMSHLRIIRDLANGFKHLKPVGVTDNVAGYGRGPFGAGPFGVPYLLIELSESQEGERWTDCHTLCKRVLEWWIAQLAPVSGEPEERD